MTCHLNFSCWKGWMSPMFFLSWTPLKILMGTNRKLMLLLWLHTVPGSQTHLFMVCTPARTLLCHWGEGLTGPACFCWMGAVLSPAYPGLSLWKKDSPILSLAWQGVKWVKNLPTHWGPLLWRDSPHISRPAEALWVDGRSPRFPPAHQGIAGIPCSHQLVMRGESSCWGHMGVWEGTVQFLLSDLAQTLFSVLNCSNVLSVIEYKKLREHLYFILYLVPQKVLKVVLNSCNCNHSHAICN